VAESSAREVCIVLHSIMEDKSVAHHRSSAHLLMKFVLCSSQVHGDYSEDTGAKIERPVGDEAAEGEAAEPQEVVGA
jgi:hypothetical protein